ncbi:MAG: hypothetical protein O2963_02240 [Proteobacteria bacterium]|nr:hypothetical protein [Pseudomonadota bacterium]
MERDVLSFSTLFENCGKYVDSDPDALLLCQAKRGNEEAQYQVGMNAYYIENYKEARTWFRRAASGRAYEYALYQPPIGNQKYGTTIMLPTNSGSEGHSRAKSMLALMYEKGLGVDVDIKKANKYRKMIGLEEIKI